MNFTLTDDLIKKELAGFISIYGDRPFKDNTGGMKAPHMFGTYCMVRNLNPDNIVESGVFHGQGTWLLSKIAENAKLHCIEPHLGSIQHKIPSAKYYSDDFSKIDFSSLDKDKTLIFFDDHQNALDRIKICTKLGFKHLIFEDNYPNNQGDCVSIKKVLSGMDYLLDSGGNKSNIKANIEDTEFLKEHINIYYEFPPLFSDDTNRWNEPWDTHETKNPILSISDKDIYPILHKERFDYTWICYVNLKNKNI